MLYNLVNRTFYSYGISNVIDSSNGDFVEISGKNYLNVQNASVDTSALKGNIGNCTKRSCVVMVST